jgi:cytochrome c oxidase subunit 2
MIIYYAGIISFIASLILVFIFVFILINRFPKKTASEVSGGMYKIRAKYFYVLLITVIISSYVALSYTPYPKKSDVIDAHVTVVGQKWLWHLHNGPYSENSLQSSTNESIVLPAKKQIRFHVTASDVNHGFGVYNSDGRLLSQVQAMPGHVNRLLMSFEKPGKYNILCMEYCGVGHHVMQESFIVK